MQILTLENKSFDVDSIGMEIDEVYFWVLEYSNNADDTDYFTKPLLFLENFSDIRLQIKIGNFHFHMPKDWSILCADAELGTAEILQPKMPGFNEKNFTAFCFNPQTGFMPDYVPIEVVSPLPETKWVVPKLKFGQMLAVPLTMDENPPVVFITHQKNNKVPEVIDLDNILQ